MRTSSEKEINLDIFEVSKKLMDFNIAAMGIGAYTFEWILTSENSISISNLVVMIFGIMVFLMPMEKIIEIIWKIEKKPYNYTNLSYTDYENENPMEKF